MTKASRTIDMQGFSLIELMIVIAVIGIIASIAYPSYTKHLQQSRRSEAVASMLNTQNKLEQFFAQNNTYPTSLAQLPSPPPSGAAQATSAGLNYYYTYSRPTATSYTLTAIAASAAQLRDTACSSNMTVDSQGNQSPTTCWAH